MSEHEAMVVFERGDGSLTEPVPLSDVPPGPHFAIPSANIYEPWGGTCEIPFCEGHRWGQHYIQSQDGIAGYLRSLGVEPPLGTLGPLTVYDKTQRPLTPDEQATLQAWLDEQA